MGSHAHDPQHATGDPTWATRTSSYKPTVRYISGTRYDVQSRTRPDHIHHVDTYRLSCTCEAGRWGKRCWAMAAALQFEAWCEHEIAKAQAASAAPIARSSGMAARSVGEAHACPPGTWRLQDAF